MGNKFTEMTREAGKKILAERIDDFEKNKAILTRKGHGETNLRTNYIDVLFQALGWNMTNVYEVDREYSQKDNSSTKKVDYGFKINGKLKFFVEAKEANVDLENNKNAIYQAKRYAYSTNGKAPIVILTDFEEFLVFSVLKAPLYDNTDRELLKKHSMRYSGYLANWDLLWDTFSRESVKNGSLDALRGKIDKNTKMMDVEFLEQITGWREDLARNIAIRNKELSVDELNEAVQRILDRLLFIRNLEDREIEPENTLLDITKKPENIYQSIVPIFNYLDNVYNGLLFKKHFSEELIVDDKTIKDIIKNMCYPVSPFQFDVIEPEILGRIYEKFLGSKIRLTENHQAKIEEKIEVRKAGGVYYTPEYIVNYIVQNIVGKKIEGLNPEEIKKIKIVDPACGSGSFLLGAYSCLLDYHAKWYLSHKTDKAYKNDYYISKDGEFKVNLYKRGDILRNNIFGVDIDKEATEVAIMSLYLKMLDDGFDKGERDLFFIKGHVLPDMTNNVKCGNSLIGTDYFDGQFVFNTDEMKDIKPFDWKTEFPEIFNNDGFDCAIGNPPYIRIQSLQEYQPETIPYLKSKYHSASTGNIDIYVIFVEKGLSSLNKNGKLGFILPSKFFATDYGTEIRKIITEKKALYKVIDFGHLQVFDNATTYTCLMFLSNKPVAKAIYTKIKNPLELVKDETTSILIENSNLTDLPWMFSTNTENLIAEKLLKNSVPLSALSRIGRGSSSGDDNVFMQQNKKGSFSTRTNEIVNIENEILRIPIYATDFNRYTFSPKSNEAIIFPYKINENGYELISENEMKSIFPKAYEYLISRKKELESRKQYKSWYGYSAPRNLDVHEKAHILIPLLADRGLFCRLPQKSNDYCLMASGGFSITINAESGLSPNYILGLLNSRLLFWRLSMISNIFRGGWITCTKQYVETLPIYKINFTIESEKLHYDNMISLVDQMLQTKKDFRSAKSESDKKLYEQKISILDKKIDELVYKLYGLTDDEIKIVEDA